MIVFIDVSNIAERRKELNKIRLNISRYLDELNKLKDIISINEGFSSLTSYLIRLSNCLMTLRREDLLMI